MDEIFEFIFKNRRAILTILILATGLMLFVIILIQKVFFKPGDFSIHDGKYREAIEKLFLAVNKNDNNWKLHLRIGFCYFMLGDNSQSLNFFEKVLNLKQKSIIAKYHLTFLFIDIGDFVKADMILKELKSLSEKKTRARKLKQFHLDELIGWYLFCKGDSKEALLRYEKVIGVIGREFESKNIKKSKLYTPLFSNFGQIYIKRNIPVVFRVATFLLAQGKIEQARQKFNFILKVADKETIFYKNTQEEIKIESFMGNLTNKNDLL